MFISETLLSRILLVAAVSLPLAACLGAASFKPLEAVELPPTTVAFDIQRGQLLYEAQCVSCHDTEMHWRDKSIVGSWSDLLVQVDRWQDNIGQKWSPSDIGDVAAYLNAVYYKMPCSTPDCLGQLTAETSKPFSVMDSK